MEKIELACDHVEGKMFAQYLRAHGYDVVVGSTTGNYINGVSTSDAETSERMNNLWETYCSS